MRCCIGDAGAGPCGWWSSAVALQGDAANHPELLRSRAVVVSVRRVRRAVSASGVGQEGERERSTDDRSCRSRGSASLRRVARALEAFRRRDLYEVQLAALFLDAVFLSVRPNGRKEGVLVAWGFTEEGERVLLSVMLGMHESHEDWLSLARDLIARGLGAPLLIVADGAPGLVEAVEQCWSA